jgi:hypothetical protein
MQREMKSFLLSALAGSRARQYAASAPQPLLDGLHDHLIADCGSAARISGTLSRIPANAASNRGLHNHCAAKLAARRPGGQVAGGGGQEALT